MTLRAREAKLQERCRYLTISVFVLLAIVFALAIGWNKAQDKVEINIRPQLPNKSVVLKGHGIDPASAFQFVVFELQSIYHWKKNGQSDFAINLRESRESRHISHEVYRQFRAEYFTRLGRSPSGEVTGSNTLVGRERIDTVPRKYNYSDDLVEVTEEGVIVTVVMDQRESVNNAPIKSPRVRYQYLVARNSESDANTYNMQIVERLAKPVRIMK